MRLDACRDGNESEIVAALKKAGCDVVRLSAKDIPDLLVGRAGRNYLLEVKTKTGKLSEGQKEFQRDWRGQCVVVRTIDEALRAVSLL